MPADYKAIVREYKQALAGLSKRERQALALRNGLDGLPAMTLRAAGARMGICPSRVWQLERAAAWKLFQALGLSKRVGKFPLQYPERLWDLEFLREILSEKGVKQDDKETERVGS